MKRLPFGSKFCVFNSFLGVTEMIIYLPQQLSKNSLDSGKLSPEVFHTRYYEKKQATMFFSLVIKLFFKILCFQQVVRSWKKAPIGSTKSFKLACGPLCYISWALAQSIIRRKLGQKLLSSWKSYFLKCLFLSTPEVLRIDLITSTVIARKRSGPL